MSRSVAMSALRARIRKEADTGPDTTTGRHTNLDINTMINVAWQNMRELVSDNGHQLYLKATTPATMTAGALSGYSFGTVSLPADCVSVYGIDLTVSTTDIRSLQQIQWSERNQYRDVYGGATGIPVAFHIYNTGVESGSSVTAGTIALFPAPDRAYTYSIWYLPSWVDKTQDTDVFDGLAGFDDWIVWDCVIRLAAADNDMAQTVAIASRERDLAQARMLRRANSIQRVGPARKQDIAARERTSRAWSFWRRP